MTLLPQCVRRLMIIVTVSSGHKHSRNKWWTLDNRQHRVLTERPAQSAAIKGTPGGHNKISWFSDTYDRSGLHRRQCLDGNCWSRSVHAKQEGHCSVIG
jgi:hypothetical protein